MKGYGDVLKGVFILVFEELSYVVKEAFFVADVVVVFHSIG